MKKYNHYVTFMSPNNQIGQIGYFEWMHLSNSKIPTCSEIESLREDCKKDNNLGNQGCMIISITTTLNDNRK